MDPTANLQELLQLAKKLQDYERDSPADDVWRMAELILSLDRWLSSGGFLPAQWNR